MFVIGELINGMYSAVGEAIKEKNKKVIQDLCQKQISCGADCLDVNCGPASRSPATDMQWLIATIQEVTDKPLSIDSSKPEVVLAGLEVAKNSVMINSTTADPEKLAILIPLAKRYHAKLIALTLSSQGVPQNKDLRLELAAQIVSACSEAEFPLEDLYIDPVLLPINVAQSQLKDILEAIREFKIISEPAPKTIVGLSNISQGTKKRSLVNRTFLTMAVGYGLDAAIINPCDNELMDSLIAAELIMNKQIYCEAFLQAYRKK